MTAARRISLPLLIDLLSITGNQVAEFWQTVDLGGLGEAMSWAGPGPAPAWLDAARDFSEYWTHHQQICEATRRAGLVSPNYLRPVLDTFMRALPNTLRHVTAAKGTALQMTVTGPGGGNGPASAARTAGGCSASRTRGPPPGSNSTPTRPGGWAPAVSLPSRRPDTPASTATSTWRQHRGRLVFTEGRGA